MYFSLVWGGCFGCKTAPKIILIGRNVQVLGPIELMQIGTDRSSVPSTAVWQIARSTPAECLMDSPFKPGG
jgi:hypothetical protein